MKTPIASSNESVGQSRWQRIILLCVLGYEGAGCLLGGSFLVVAQNGHLMDMPVSLMNGVFRDFLVPGIILFGLGILNVAAFVAVLRRTRSDSVMAGLALGGLAIWFWVEISILQQLHWLHIMWGLPVVIGIIVSIPLARYRHWTMREIMLVCGILSSVLYAAMNIFVAMQWEVYNSASQTVSELSAIDAPTRALWVGLGALYTLLGTAFGWGVRISGANNKRLRIAGLLLFIYAALGVVWPFAPMHLRERLAVGGGTISDTMHLTLAGITEIIYLLALGFSAAALGKKFRIYSITTFMILMFFGALTFLEAPGVSTNQPTPLIGVWERINIGVFLLWVVVLAVALLRIQVKRLEGS